MSPGVRTSRWLQEHRETATDSLQRLWRQRLGSLMTMSVIGIALLLPALLLTGVSTLATLGSGLQDSARISLYLETGVSAGQRDALRAELAADERVRELTYISPEQAAEDFARYSGFGDVISALPENPLPATLELLPASTDPRVVETLADELAGHPEAAQVQVDLAWVQRLDALLELGRRAALALALIIAVAVLFIVGNTIRLAIESRRDEIMVVKLIGGTDAFVSRPFLYTGAWCGLGGGLLGSALLLVLYALMNAPLQRLSTQYGGEALDGPAIAMPLLSGGLVVVSTALGWLGALLSVRQHLDAIEPR